jgi:hypothetical protein
MIDKKAAAHFVEILLNFIEITVVVYGYFKNNIEPQYVYYTSLFFPFPGVTWMIYLGQIASNKNIMVKLGQSNVIVNETDLTTVFHNSVILFLVKVVIMVYLWPIKIWNSPKEINGAFYLCKPRFWRRLCHREKVNDRRDSVSTVSEVDLAFSFSGESGLEEAYTENVLTLKKVTVK